MQVADGLEHLCQVVHHDPLLLLEQFDALVDGLHEVEEVVEGTQLQHQSEVIVPLNHLMHPDDPRMVQFPKHDHLDHHLVHLPQLLQLALLQRLHREQLVGFSAPHLEDLPVGALVELALGLEILAAEHLVDQRDLLLHDLYYISCIKIIIQAHQLR